MDIYDENITSDLSALIGRTMVEVTENGDNLWMKAEDGTEVSLYHAQDCCESVYIENIEGDLEDLVGSPLIMAEEISDDAYGDKEMDDYEGSETWTFYKFATVKGYVTIRWYGSSNGCYSEEVSVAICLPIVENKVE